jgi:hypothetical protein
MANLQNLKPWKKGQSGNPKGSERKYVNALKDQGYTKTQINDTIRVMTAMTIQELKEVFDNPIATILEKTIANALVMSLKKGSLDSLETLFTRWHGKPREQLEIQQDSRIEVVFIEGKTIL